MSNVFANFREISGKATNNKSIAALPDVCMSPPAPPAGPVPLPYPNTAMASDCTGGSKTVKIGGKEVSLKNASTYSKSTGDEPATQSFGANIVTHKIQGPLRFAAWSSDVKFEGENVVRLGDLTTHNHINTQGAQAVTASVAGATAPPPPPSCDELEKENRKTRDSLSSDKRKTAQKLGNDATTITHAVFTPTGGAAMTMKACSRALMGKFKAGFAKGGPKAGKEGLTASICSEPFKFEPAGRPLTSHTEARLIQDIMAMTGGAGGGSLTLAINWNKSATPNSPCTHCKRLLCHAAKCLDIKLCSDGEAVKLQCP